MMLPEQQGPDCELNHSNDSGLTRTAAESRQTGLGHVVREWVKGLTETLWRSNSAANRIAQPIEFVSQIDNRDTWSIVVNRGTGTRISGEREKQFDQQMIEPIGNWTNRGTGD